MVVASARLGAGPPSGGRGAGRWRNTGPQGGLGAGSKREGSAVEEHELPKDNENRVEEHEPPNAS